MTDGQLLQGVIASTPTDGLVDVVITGFDGEQKFTDVLIAPGVGVAVAGDGCLVAFDDAGAAWVVTGEFAPAPPPPGPVGGVERDQASAMTVWTINHGLGFRPSVTVFERDAGEISGDVTHLDANTLTVKFSAAVSGTAYLS